MATVKKRPLTQEEIADAARLRLAWKEFQHDNPGSTQEWLGIETGLGNQSLISQYLRGIIPLNLPALLAICRVIKIEPHKISPTLAKSVPKFQDINVEAGPDIRGDVPVISWVTAGNWEEVVDIYQPGVAEDWLPCPKKHGDRTFALRVRGVSMENLGGRHSYSDGDIIFVDPDRHPENGSRVVVRLDDSKEATFKQLIKEGDKQYLKALNPAWPEKIIEIDGNATICGVVIGKWIEE